MGQLRHARWKVVQNAPPYFYAVDAPGLPPARTLGNGL
jgi:hypothetical protein